MSFDKCWPIETGGVVPMLIRYVWGMRLGAC